jgi:predicted lipoprotein
MLIYGKCMIHIDENGKESRIEPYSEGYYTAQKALQKLDQQPIQLFENPSYEKLNNTIKELEEQIVTYCRENPTAEEWFQITVKRD